MNYKMIFYTIGHILKLEALLLVLPLIVSFIYKENLYLSYLIPMGVLLLVGFALTIKKPHKKEFYAKEGFLIVGLSWIVMSLFGCLPFIISGEIPSFINAFFETVSGFTTTGASILKGDEVETLSHSILFWRSFTHWIGGMGILVFILAIMPSSEGRNIYILKAESPGPQVGKLVSRVRITARILYLIYIVLTIIEVIFLLIGKMPLFDSIVNSFATAGTGGFAIKGASIGHYNEYCQIVIGIFMIIFGINFSFFYLLLIGNVKQALKSEEIYWYLGIIFFSVVAISINLYCVTSEALGVIVKDSFFQVSSIITTTGFATADFNTWPVFSQNILLLLMFIGACAGSTGGGMKVSRFAIMIKGIKGEVRKLIHPRSVSNVRFEGHVVEKEVVKSVTNYFALLVIIFIACVLLISIDNNFSFINNFSAVAACINNIGPGFDLVGPNGNYDMFSSFSKSILIFAMLIGRLEIYPILMLLSPRIWANK